MNNSTPNGALYSGTPSGLRRCLLVVTAGLTLILSLNTTAWCQFHVVLSPQVVTLKARPGSSPLVQFELQNQNPEKTAAIRVTASEIIQGISGEYRLSDSVQSYSCADWLTLPDTLIVIEPNASLSVPVGISVPFTARGGAYAAVVFEVLSGYVRPVGGQGMPAHVDYRFQMPAWIELEVDRPGGSKTTLLPGEITLRKTKGTPELERRYGSDRVIVSVEVENTGNIHVITHGRLVIRDQSHRLVKDVPLGSGRGLVLPGAKTRLQSIVRELPRAGAYTAKAIVNYGGRSPAISQSTFEITSSRAERVGALETALPLYFQYRPEEFDESIPGGGFRVFGVSVVNREEVPVKFEVQRAPMAIGYGGQVWVSEDTTDTGRTCLPWLSIEPQEFTLAPSRRQNIRITADVPDDASGGYYGCVVLNAISAEDTTVSRLPSPSYIPLYMTVPTGIAPAGEIVRVGADQMGATSVALRVAFRNTGNIHYAIRGSALIQRWMDPKASPAIEGLEVTDTARFVDLVTVDLETDSSYVLPGHVRTVSSQTMEGLPPGRYVAYVAVSFGGPAPVTRKQEFIVEEPSIE